MSRERKIETFHVSTYGCQMNLADSATLCASLITRGYRRVAEEKDADLIVLNTCSVREKAEDRVLGRLGEIKGFKDSRPGMKIAVVGCMAQRLGEDLIRRAPHVDYVLGTDRLFELPDLVEGLEGTSGVMTAFGHENIDDIQPTLENAHSGFVTISRGCENFCTYCIVPYVRGKERSHSADHIIAAVRKMVDEGAVEVTLLGQNVNSYSFEGMDFPDLLKRVAAESGCQRIRFMTSHPKDLSAKLVATIAAEPKIMPHIHLPLQSGSDRVLKRMGRVYSYDHYRGIVENIRSQLDYVTLTTDLIVGFPSETLEEFEMTLAAVRDIQYDSAFMFRYSVRSGTTAAGFDDDVPEEEKIRRLNELIALQQQVSFERNQREVGEIRYSVIEGPSRRSGQFARARTEGNKTVIFETDRIDEGTVVPVRITSADAFTLHGEPVETN